MEKMQTDTLVLLVDDELDICVFLSEYLAHNNIESFSATTIDQALNIAHNNHICAVFLDNNLLNNVQGVEYIPQFKQINPNCKVYMLTSDATDKTRQRAHLLGADGFIVKPFDFETFNEILKSLSNH